MKEEEEEHGAHSSGFSFGTLIVAFWLAEAARVIGSPEPSYRIRSDAPRVIKSPELSNRNRADAPRVIESPEPSYRIRSDAPLCRVTQLSRGPEPLSD